MSPNDKVLAWNAFNEKKKFKNQLLPNQNRLFENFTGENLNSFSQFRKKVEPILPDYFEDAITPNDSILLEELDYYFHQKKLPETYLATRNEMVGRDYSTKFSPFLSCGVLDPKFLYNQIKDFEKKHGESKSTYWIIFELLWREFFYWHYQQFDNLYFAKQGIKSNIPDFNGPKDYSIDEILRLSTEPFFSAALKELFTTGFLSNRARQIFASIWINDLKLDWLSGALFFEKHLIDYDVYSNYGNWMYLAGLGVDPRGKRYFNVEKQLKQYDPKSEYLNKWGAK